MTDENSTSSPTRRSILAGAAGIGIAAAAVTSQRAEAQAAGDFAGKTAFVTGAARGIGLACAEELAKGGADVVLYDIASQPAEVPYPLATAEDLAAAKSKMEGYGVGCLAIAGDVRDAPALTSAVEQTITEFGSLDFLIVNAGITQPGRLGGFSQEQIKTIMDINLVGSVHTLQAALPQMQSQNAGLCDRPAGQRELSSLRRHQAGDDRPDKKHGPLRCFQQHHRECALPDAREHQASRQ